MSFDYFLLIYLILKINYFKYLGFQKKKSFKNN